MSDGFVNWYLRDFPPVAVTTLLLPLEDRDITLTNPLTERASWITNGPEEYGDQVRTTKQQLLQRIRCFRDEDINFQLWLDARVDVFTRVRAIDPSIAVLEFSLDGMTDKEEDHVIASLGDLIDRHRDITEGYVVDRSGRTMDVDWDAAVKGAPVHIPIRPDAVELPIGHHARRPAPFPHGGGEESARLRRPLMVPQRLCCFLCGRNTAEAEDYVTVTLSAENSEALQRLGAHASCVTLVCAPGFATDIPSMPSGAEFHPSKEERNLHSMGDTRAEESTPFADGCGSWRLDAGEVALLAEHLPAPEGRRALDVCGGGGELAALVSSMGYTVDAIDPGGAPQDYADHAAVAGVRWLRVDVADGDLDQLDDDGYDLITLSLPAGMRDRSRVLHRLAGRLRQGGALVVIAPLAEHTPAGQRHLAVTADDLATLTAGFDQVERFDAAGMALLVLRSPGGSYAAVEKLRPSPQAVFGAAVVLTDASGRVLLGRSTRGMWELPGGRIESGESAPATAVRELAEETGLTAREEDACVLTMLHDDREDIRRVSAVVRVTGWDGALGLPEPHRFTRWEWHDLHTLKSLGRIFAPSAQAMNAVWPGVLPDLPPLHSYPLAACVPAVPGEPAEAVRLRARMTDAVIDGGWAPSPRVQAALRTVPRHRFAPEVPLETAYDDDLAVVTARDEDGTAVSSVSAAWLQADMIEQLRLEQGMTVLEVGSGGYNAALLAHVVGEAGRVITVDLDPYVVHRTERLGAEAGSGRVIPVLGDGGLGAPGHMPAGGFDATVVTHNATDIAPAWREQLAPGRRLVVPLSVGGYTRSITLLRRGEVLHAEHWTFCGFVRDRGAAARTTPSLSLADGDVTLRWEDGAPGDTDGLEEALRGPRHDLATGVIVPGQFSFATLQLYAATTLTGFCRIASREDSALVERRDAAALTADGSLAYLTCPKIHDAPEPADRRFEFHIHAYGPNGPGLAERFADCVRAWDRHVRETGYPPMTIHPAGAPDAQLPPGDVLDKPSSRMVFAWPGRTPTTTPAPPVAAEEPV